MRMRLPAQSDDDDMALTSDNADLGVALDLSRAGYIYTRQPCP